MHKELRQEDVGDRVNIDLHRMPFRRGQSGTMERVQHDTSPSRCNEGVSWDSSAISVDQGNRLLLRWRDVDDEIQHVVVR